jgi:predicted AAA+ superfamily ATPase
MYHRYLMPNIKAALADTPVVFIMGPRQSGKTTLTKTLINPEWTYITFDDQAQLALAKSDPIAFIRNMPTQQVVLDEVQKLPELFVAIKQSVDENRQPGRFLLTGSANALLLPRLSDSLAGRIEALHLTTLSECEICNVQPSFLTKLLAGNMPISLDNRIRDYLLKRLVTGAYPEPLQRRDKKRISAWYKQYINALIQRDILDLDHIDHPDKMSKLMQLLAYYSAKLINFSEIGSMLELGHNTVKKYISLLEQLFLLETLPAWHSNEYKRLVKTPKIHLLDTGIICALRNLTTEKLKLDPQKLGPLVETFVYSELRKQANFIDEPLVFSHYRDKDKVEIDIIIENSEGEYIAIEVKSTATLHSKDFVALKHFQNITQKRFKMGILLYDGDHSTAFGDNLYAVPLGALWS